MFGLFLSSLDVVDSLYSCSDWGLVKSASHLECLHAAVRGWGGGSGWGKGGTIEIYEYQKDFLSFMAVLFARGSNWDPPPLHPVKSLTHQPTCRRRRRGFYRKGAAALGAGGGCGREGVSGISAWTLCLALCCAPLVERVLVYCFLHDLVNYVYIEWWSISINTLLLLLLYCIDGKKKKRWWWCNTVILSYIMWSEYHQK